MAVARTAPTRRGDLDVPGWTFQTSRTRADALPVRKQFQAALVALTIIVGGGYAAVTLISHARTHARSAWIEGGNQALRDVAPVAGTQEGPAGNCHPSATQRCFHSSAGLQDATGAAKAMFRAAGGSNVQVRCDRLTSVTASCVVSADVPHSHLVANLYPHVDYRAWKRLGHRVVSGSDIWIGVRDAPV